MHISKQSFNELNYVSFTFSKKKIWKGNHFCIVLSYVENGLWSRTAPGKECCGLRAEWREVSVPRI